MRKQITIPYYNLREAQDGLRRVETAAGKDGAVQLRLRRLHHAGETAQDSQEVLYKHARALNAFCRRTGSRTQITIEQETSQPRQKKTRRTLSTTAFSVG